MANGAPDRNRTCGLQIRNLPLYPTELRAPQQEEYNVFLYKDKKRKEMVRLAGVEPATYGFEVRHSIQLSYRRIKINVHIFYQKNKKIARKG